jgi:hypothetical protein
MVFQPRTISACIVVGDSRNLVILTDTNQTSNARLAPSNARARELLEFSRSTVDKIAATVGHDDASGLISKEQKVVERLLLAQSGRSHNGRLWKGRFWRKADSSKVSSTVDRPVGEKPMRPSPAVSCDEAAESAIE